MEEPISSIMSTPVITASEDVFLYEAFHILENNSIRHLVVVDQEGLASGVLTLSGLIEQIGSDFFIEFQPVEKLMSRVVYTVREDLSLRDILAEMSERSISCILYSTNAKPQGILTERDIVRLATQGFDFETTTVTQAMSAPVATVRNDAQVHEVARQMREQSIRRVVVVNGRGETAGLVTQSNIVHGLESSYIKVLKEVIEQKDSALSDAASERDQLALYLDSILNSSIDMAIVATNMDLEVVYFNHVAEELLGYPANEAIGKPVQYFHEREGIPEERFQSILERVRAERSYTFGYERERDGETRHYQARVAGIWDSRGNLKGYVHLLQDVTERKKAEENIRFMAYHDILTGLPNRVAFDERFSLELARAQRGEHQVAVMLMDLDRFKEINDTMGHYAGDLLLQAVAERLLAVLRKSDTLARVGGDEFALVLPEVKGVEDARIIADKLVDALRTPMDIKGEEVTINVSVGISFYPDHGDRPRALLDRADQAMYRAKELGHESGCSGYAFAGDEPDDAVC